jgi:glycosyltransferase involved in cell wall biosynthesis
MYLGEACRVLSWVRAHRTEHIHAHFGTNSADVAMLVNALGGPSYSFTVHGPEEFFRPVGLSEKIRRAAFVVAISSFGRSQLSLWSSVTDWPKIQVVHCGLEKRFYSESSDQPAPARRLISVGRLVPEKGQLLLVEATARLALKGVRFELVLVGDGPMRRALEELIAKHQLEDRTRITGWISGDDVRREMLAARALVLPSFAEGLPVVIMEAMALKRPVIATYIAGVPELVLHGENGWLIPASSVDELTTAIENCLSRSPEELGKMGERAYLRVIERHSIDQQVAKLAGLFRATSPGSSPLPKEARISA